MQQDLLAENFPTEEPEFTVPVISRSKGKLTLAQSEFNQLNKAIALLKENLNNLPEKVRRAEEFYQQNVLPVVSKSDHLMLDLLIKWDVRYKRKEFSGNDLFDLSGLILDKCRAVMEASRGMFEDDKKTITKLMRKHEIIQTGLSAKALDKERVVDLLKVFVLVTGFEPTAKMKKAKTEEEAGELIAEFMEKETQKESNEQSSKSEKKDSFGPFSFQRSRVEERMKQKRRVTQTDLKEKMREEQIQKSIRSIYMELVKELHPDREQDDLLRMVKEGRMKQLTDAYQKNDLSALLMMQVSWLQESITLTSGKLPDAVIKGYNSVLRSQKMRLEDEQRKKINLTPNIPEEVSKLLFASIDQLNAEMELYLLSEQSDFTQLQLTVNSWNTEEELTKLIKEYQQEKEHNSLFEQYFNHEGLNALLRKMSLGKMKF